MRSKLFYKVQDLSSAQFNQLGVSSLITRSTSDITNLQQTLGMLLQMVVPAPIIVVVSVVMTAQISPVIALLQILFMAMLLTLAAVVLRRSNALSRSIQSRLDRINKVLREAITGVRVIRAFDNETYEEQRSGQAYESYADNMIRLNRLFAVAMPAVWLLMGGIMIVVLGVGGYFSLSGVMAVGSLTTLPKAQSCLDRLEQVLDMNPAIQDGQTTAVIGSTGSGKSTMADLLLRLHDVQSGTIFLGGRDIRSLSQQELRRRIGCVPQKAFLFSGTIAENLRMGREDADDAALWEALVVAQAEDFVKKLPLGLESLVSQGGTNFSGGQGQPS